MELLLALIVAFFALIGFQQPHSPTVPPTPVPCSPAVAVHVPGTLETNANADPQTPVGILREALVPGVKNIYPAYPASFVFPSYADSIAIGVSTTTQTITEIFARCPNTKLALTGFSQGAQIAATVATKITRGETIVPRHALVGVSLIADPERNPETVELIGTPVGGAGIFSARQGDFGDVPAITFCAPGDPVCSSPASGQQDAINQFFMGGGSSIHNSYNTYQVAPGKTAPQFTRDWLIEQFAK